MKKALPLVFGLFALGCAHVPKPVDFGERGEITDPNVLFELLLAQTPGVERVRGEAKAKVDTPEGAGSLTEFVVASRPDRLRLESIDFFGRPVALLTTDGEVGRMLDVERNVFFEGPANATVVARLLPVRIDPRVVVSLLTGGLGLGAAPVPQTVRVDPERGVYVLALETTDGPQTVSLNPRTLHPLIVTTDEWAATFEGWRNDSPLPSKVTLSTPDGRAKVTLTWRDTELDPALDPDVFTLVPPPGAQMRRF